MSWSWWVACSRRRNGSAVLPSLHLCRHWSASASKWWCHWDHLTQKAGLHPDYCEQRCQLSRSGTHFEVVGGRECHPCRIRFSSADITAGRAERGCRILPILSFLIIVGTHMYSCSAVGMAVPSLQNCSEGPSTYTSECGCLPMQITGR